MREVGAEIRRLREGRGWTGAQLAVYAGMAPSAVSQIETGKRSPNTGSLEKIANALEVEVGDLFPKAETPLWSGEATERRFSSSFSFSEVREALDDYCESWEELISKGGLDERAVDEFVTTGAGWLPALSVALTAEMNETTAPGEQPRTEIGRANRRYLKLSSKIFDVMKGRLLEEYDGDLAAESNVVRLQEFRDRLQNRAVG